MLVPRRVKTLRRTLRSPANAVPGSNCESTFETIDVTRVAQAISRCVHDVGQRVGSGKIVKILRGSRAQDLAWLNPERMPTFGMLKDVNEARVRDVLSQVATDGYLSIAKGVCQSSCSVRGRPKPPLPTSTMRSNGWNASRRRPVPVGAGEWLILPIPANGSRRCAGLVYPGR